MELVDYINPDTYRTVRLVMGGFAAVYVIMEVVLNLNDMPDDTSNIILLDWSKGRALFIPFALGAIGGHLFLGTSNPAFELTNSMYPVLILAILCIIGLVVGSRWHFERTTLFQSALLLAGLAYGHLFWSMDHPAIP